MLQPKLPKKPPESLKNITTITPRKRSDWNPGKTENVAIEFLENNVKSKILKKPFIKRQNQNAKIKARKNLFEKWEWIIEGGGKAYIKMFRTTRRHLEGCGRTAEQGVLRQCACSCLQHEPLPMGENMLAESDVARFNSGPRTDLSKFGLPKTYPDPPWIPSAFARERRCIIEKQSWQ